MTTHSVELSPLCVSMMAREGHHNPPAFAHWHAAHDPHAYSNYLEVARRSHGMLAPGGQFIATGNFILRAHRRGQQIPCPPALRRS